jgi:hypothetical protein
MTEYDIAAVDLSGILNKPAEDKAKQLPDPRTFHILCVVPEAMQEYAESEIGIIKSTIKEAILDGQIENSPEQAFQLMLEIGQNLGLTKSN